MTDGTCGTSGSSGSGSYFGVAGVTPCCGSKASIGSIVDNDISFYCNECKMIVLRKNFITFEEYTNNDRFKKLNIILK